MAGFKIEWSVEARMDILDILEFYIKRNNSAFYSRKLYTEINKHIKLLSSNPFLGIKTDIKSVRTLIHNHFQLIYEIHDKTIVIVMIWDTRRNPEVKQKKLFKRGKSNKR
jgi:plasmid stabilization system protein ParE